jgi:hypothetical protein
MMSFHYTLDRPSCSTEHFSLRISYCFVDFPSNAYSRYLWLYPFIASCASILLARSPLREAQLFFTVSHQKKPGKLRSGPRHPSQISKRMQKEAEETVLLAGNSLQKFNNGMEAQLLYEPLQGCYRLASVRPCHFERCRHRQCSLPSVDRLL